MWQTAPRLTNASCYSKYQGIPTPLSTSGHREYQLFPYYAAVDHFIKGRPRRYQHSFCRTSLPPGDTNTPVNTAERLTLIQRQPYRLFSFRLTLQRIPSTVDNNKGLSIIAQLCSHRQQWITDLFTNNTSLLHLFIYATKAPLSQVFNVHP